MKKHQEHHFIAKSTEPVTFEEVEENDFALPPIFHDRVSLDVIHDGAYLPPEFLQDAEGNFYNQEDIQKHFVIERDWGANFVAARLAYKLGLPGFLTVNTAAIDDNYEALYGWKADGTGYEIYNHTFNSNSAVYIAPGQGFWVAAASTSSANLSFTEAMQTATGGDDFIAGRTTSTSFELVLDMHNDDIKVSDTKFYFKEGLTLGLDPGYDAGAFNQSSGLSSRLVEQDNGVGMGINAMPVDVLSNVIVPLTIEQEAGIALKIQIANSTIPEDINVYLEDAMENTFTLLTNESFELLTQTALSGMGRFFIHFTSSTLSTDTAGSTSLLTAYKGKGNAYISVEGLQQFSEPAQLTLYNVLGIKILSKNIQNPSQKEMLSTVGMKTGVYIIKVQAENIVFTKKLIIE